MAYRAQSAYDEEDATDYDTPADSMVYGDGPARGAAPKGGMVYGDGVVYGDSGVTYGDAAPMKRVPSVKLAGFQGGATSEYGEIPRQPAPYTSQSCYDNADGVEYILADDVDVGSGYKPPSAQRQASQRGPAPQQSRPISEMYLDVAGGPPATGYNPMNQGRSSAPAAQSKDEERLLRMSWYKGGISRDDAEGMLTREAEGVFLVRRGKKPSTFVLSVRVQGGFSHLEITSKSTPAMKGGMQTVWVLGAFSHPHESVEAIIEHHRSNEIEIVGKPFVCLRNP